jgi:transposase InsO family protein
MLARSCDVTKKAIASRSVHADTRQDVFDYIEMFYKPRRKHTKNGMLSPVDFERQRETTTEGVWKTRGYSERV